MLTVEEIRNFIEADMSSDRKKNAMVGDRYFRGENDIKQYRIFFFNADDILVEDKTRNNAKIAHNFHKEISVQVSQYILSGDKIIKSDNPELQNELDKYFNDNEEFLAELSETITGCVSKGYEYMYGYKNEKDMLSFQCANCIGVTEVRAKDTDANTEYMIFRYPDRIEKGTKTIWRIQVWDSQMVHFYVQENDGKIEKDTSEEVNPRPHTLYREEGTDETTYKPFGFIPFFRLDNNKEQKSDLFMYKDQVDDYDLHASSLTNNLVDFDTPIHVVRGFEGDDLSKLQQNLKTKKIIGVNEEGGIEVHTVAIPYEARLAKLELDEKNIYREGMALNTSGLKDTNATVSVAIKAAYSLLDMKATELEKRIKRFLRKIIKVVIDEINDVNGTDYSPDMVKIEFEHEVMTNEKENADIAMVEAQEQQVRIGTLLNLAAHLDTETLQQKMCEIMNWDYNELKSKLPDPDEAENAVMDAQAGLNGVVVEEEAPIEETA